MIDFSGRGILLDIEGTTSSIRFVYDVMFPFVRRELNAFLSEHWGPTLAETCDLIAREAGHQSFDAWSAGDDVRASQQRLQSEVLRLMDSDAKTTGLKQLQGLIWKAGFESGELRAHLYDDVLPAIQAWNAREIDVRIYSSGSIGAQKLFFGHTIHGDLLPLLRGHYDTTIGAKQQATSYKKIADSFACADTEILFLSDVPAELDAAREANLQTGLCLRPGNPAVQAGQHATLSSFAEIKLAT